MWHGLKELDVKPVGWWHGKLPEEKEEHDFFYDRKAGKEDWRTYTRVLHDWLHCFAVDGSLERFAFEWVGSEGPNPFTLDEFVSVDGRKEWFSAPAVRWTGLREVWLGNVVVSSIDVRRLKERMEGLEKIVVGFECLGYELAGVKIVVDGRMWVELDVRGQRMGLRSEVEKRLGLSSVADTRGSYRESSGGEDRASIVVPFFLDISPEEGTFS